jgi:hypothetical protein
MCEGPSECTPKHRHYQSNVLSPYTGHTQKLNKILPHNCPKEQREKGNRLLQKTFQNYLRNDHSNPLLLQQCSTKNNKPAIVEGFSDRPHWLSSMQQWSPAHKGSIEYYNLLWMDESDIQTVHEWQLEWEKIGSSVTIEWMNQTYKLHTYNDFPRSPSLLWSLSNQVLIQWVFQARMSILSKEETSPSSASNIRYQSPL